MKVVFISNFINHHQLPFSKEMIKLIGDGYRFIATEPIAQERLDLGYEDMNRKYSFVVCTYDGEEVFAADLSPAMAATGPETVPAPSVRVRNPWAQSSGTYSMARLPAVSSVPNQAR